MKQKKKWFNLDSPDHVPLKKSERAKFGCFAEVGAPQAKKKLYVVMEKVDGDCAKSTNYDDLCPGQILKVGDPLKGKLLSKEKVYIDEALYAKLTFSDDVLIFCDMTFRAPGVCSNVEIIEDVE